MQPQPQALMAGIGDIVPALFIIVALITGFLNFLKEKKNAAEAEAMRRRKRERNDPQADELSQFLSEVGATETAKPPQRRRKRSSQRDRAEARRRQREENSQSKQPSRKSPASSSSVATRHLETEELSRVQGRHVQSNVENRHLESQIANQHLYETDSNSEDSPQSASRHPIAKLFADLAGVRNAILLNEILQPPVSRRKR